MKKCLIAFAVLLIIGVVFLASISFRKTSNRPCQDYPLPAELKERIKSEVAGIDDAYDLIDYSCGLTAELLSFDRSNNISEGRANCIGYARLSSSICNYAYGVSACKAGSLVAKPAVGTVYCMGVNINSVAVSILPKRHRSFFKDHDFMEVVLGDETIYVDACVRDFFGFNALCRHKK